MSTTGDILSVVKKVFLVAEDITRLSGEVKALSDEVRNHEGRLIRIETMLQVASDRKSRLILPG